MGIAAPRHGPRRSPGSNLEAASHGPPRARLSRAGASHGPRHAPGSAALAPPARDGVRRNPPGLPVDRDLATPSGGGPVDRG